MENTNQPCSRLLLFPNTSPGDSALSLWGGPKETPFHATAPEHQPTTSRGPPSNTALCSLSRGTPGPSRWQQGDICLRGDWLKALCLPKGHQACEASPRSTFPSDFGANTKDGRLRTWEDDNAQQIKGVPNRGTDGFVPPASQASQKRKWQSPWPHTTGVNNGS